MEMARSMLKEKGLPNIFWVKALYTDVYMLNRCPMKTGILRNQKATKSTTYRQRSSTSVEMLRLMKMLLGWKEEKVMKNDIPISMQQPQEESEEVVGDPCMLSPSPQQESSPESTLDE
ncbi:hypothetical protein CR513_47274, partial [Mucuna pruriens]